MESLKTILCLLHKDKSQRRPNTEGLLVIGAGLPRTGTASTKVALSQLLDGPCYHMFNVADEFGNSDTVRHWHKAISQRQQVSTEEWRQFYCKGGFKAAVDMPSMIFYR